MIYAHLIIFTGSFVAFSLALFLFTKKSTGKAEIYLGSFLVSIGLFQLLHYLRVEGIMSEYLPHLLRVRFLIHGFTGTLFYLYIKESLRQAPSRPQQILLYLPAFICIALVLPYLFQSVDFKREWGFSDYSPLPYYLNYFIARSSLLFFCLIAWMTLEKDKEQTPHDTYKWLKLLIIMSFMSGLATSIITFIDLAFIDFVSYHWLHLANTVLVISIASHAIRKGWLTNSQDVSPGIKEEKQRYQSSTLDQYTADNILHKLDVLMSSEKLYLQPKLTLPKTAKIIDSSPHDVSQSLNQYRDINFNDYVNHWRIEAILNKIALGEHENKTLLGIAMDCGFNSKSSFNLAFKKHTGHTPTTYIKTKASTSKKTAIQSEKKY